MSYTILGHAAYVLALLTGAAAALGATARLLARWIYVGPASDFVVRDRLPDRSYPALLVVCAVATAIACAIPGSGKVAWQWTEWPVIALVVLLPDVRRAQLGRPGAMTANGAGSAEPASPRSRGRSAATFAAGFGMGVVLIVPVQASAAALFRLAVGRPADWDDRASSMIYFIVAAIIGLSLEPLFCRGFTPFPTAAPVATRSFRLGARAAVAAGMTAAVLIGVLHAR